MKFVSKVEHRCCHFQQYSAAKPYFCDVIPSEEAFNYHSGIWLLLSHVILSQTCSKLPNGSVEDSEVDNRWERMDFADLARDA